MSAKRAPLLKAIVWELCYRLFRSIFSFCMIKGNISENVSFTDHASGIKLPDCPKLVVSPEFNNYICWYEVIIIFFFDAAVFLLSSLVTGSSFMSISLLALELNNFRLYGIDQKFGSHKCPRLSFVQYLESGTS